jgi:shikimate kinase
MGTGKSSVGRVLANRLERPLVDVDQRIEKQENKKIAEIFEKEGEAAFRSLEKRAIAEIAAMSGAVVTTGGGAVQDPENVEALRKNGWLIALSATPETIYERVRGSQHRPLLRVADPLAEIRRLLELRKPFYAGADFFFHTDGKKASEVAREILEVLKVKTQTDGPAAGRPQI